MDRELRNKLDELTRSIDELCEQFGITKDMIPDIDDEDYDDLDEEVDACGVSLGFDLSKLFDPRYNEHILSEPDENGMVEISDELYDRLYGKYHSKEDMLSDIISEMEFYITGKYAGDEEVWAETRYPVLTKKAIGLA